MNSTTAFLFLVGAMVFLWLAHDIYKRHNKACDICGDRADTEKVRVGGTHLNICKNCREGRF